LVHFFGIINYARVGDLFDINDLECIGK
jgi:hypothetical protein